MGLAKNFKDVFSPRIEEVGQIEYGIVVRDVEKGIFFNKISNKGGGERSPN